MRITTAVSSSEFDWFTSCRAIDAMVMFNTPFRGQQELSLLGAEQTTSLLVVMISVNYKALPIGEGLGTIFYRSAESGGSGQYDFPDAVRHETVRGDLPQKRGSRLTAFLY